MFLYVAYVGTMCLSNPGKLYDETGNQDACWGGGHQIGDALN
jgi:hypothetical protein